MDATQMPPTINDTQTERDAAGLHALCDGGDGGDVLDAVITPLFQCSPAPLLRDLRALLHTCKATKRAVQNLVPMFFPSAGYPGRFLLDRQREVCPSAGYPGRFPLDRQREVCHLDLELRVRRVVRRGDYECMAGGWTPYNAFLLTGGNSYVSWTPYKVEVE